MKFVKSDSVQTYYTIEGLPDYQIEIIETPQHTWVYLVHEDVFGKDDSRHLLTTMGGSPVSHDFLLSHCKDLIAGHLGFVDEALPETDSDDKDCLDGLISKLGEGFFPCGLSIDGKQCGCAAVHYEKDDGMGHLIFLFNWGMQPDVFDDISRFCRDRDKSGIRRSHQVRLYPGRSDWRDMFLEVRFANVYQDDDCFAAVICDLLRPMERKEVLSADDVPVSPKLRNPEDTLRDIQSIERAMKSSGLIHLP